MWQALQWGGQQTALPDPTQHASFLPPTAPKTRFWGLWGSNLSFKGGQGKVSLPACWDLVETACTGVGGPNGPALICSVVCVLSRSQVRTIINDAALGTSVHRALLLFLTHFFVTSSCKWASTAHAMNLLWLRISFVQLPFERILLIYISNHMGHVPSQVHEYRVCRDFTSAGLNQISAFILPIASVRKAEYSRVVCGLFFSSANYLTITFTTCLLSHWRHF